MFETRAQKKIEKLSDDIYQMATNMHFDVQEEYGGKSEKVSFDLNEDWSEFNDPGIVKAGKAWQRQSKWVNTMHSDLEIIEFKCEKGFKMKRHDHDDHVEICIVLKGEISYPMQNRHLVSGNTIEIPMDTKHTFEAIKDSFCLLIYKPKFV